MSDDMHLDRKDLRLIFCKELQMNEPIRITSLATIGEILQNSPTINRLILKQIGESTWEITKCDVERPNNLREVAERSGGKFAYERNIKRGFEALSGYDVMSDEKFKVVYRLSSD
jgi:hypothetical protein